MLERIWRKGNPHTLWWECKLEQPLRKMVWKFLKKLKIKLSYDSAILLLAIYPKERKSLSWTDICTPMFITALFAIAKTWKQPKYPLTDEWIKKIWCIYLHKGNYSVIKRRKSCHLLPDGPWGYYAKQNKSHRKRHLS